MPTSTRCVTRSFSARRGFQRDQRAPAVAHQRRLRRRRRHPAAPTTKPAASSTLAGGSPSLLQWPGRSTRQHVPAVVREVAGLQDPHAVVVEHAVDEDHGGLGGIEGLAAGVAVGRVAVDLRYMLRAPQAFSAAFSARFRSSIRSSGSSSPIDRRIVPWRDAGGRQRFVASCGSAWCWPGGSPASGSRPRWPGG